MARRVSEQDIIEINEVYAACGNIKKTAEIVKWSEATVRKYVRKDYVAAAPIKYNDDIQIDTDIRKLAEELTKINHICNVTEEEEKELTALWKEIKV